MAVQINDGGAQDGMQKPGKFTLQGFNAKTAYLLLISFKLAFNRSSHMLFLFLIL